MRTHPLVKPGPLAPTPSESAKHPWRFRLGQFVYVAGQVYSEPYEIVGGELWLGFPHYKLRDRNGQVWRIPQLLCSSKALTGRS